MSRITSRNTLPERTVRSLLHRLGYRFRLHVRDLPGNPDIVLPKWHKVIFVHGCFWHRHAGCKYAYSPKSRTQFWCKKFEGNVMRDRKRSQELAILGWEAHVIWECEAKNAQALAKRLRGMF